MNQPSILNISWGTIAKIAVAVVMLYVVFIIRDIIVWFIFALILGILFNYLVDLLEKKRIPRIISAIFLYLVVFALLSFFIYKTTPVLWLEIREFVQSFPQYVKKVMPIFEKLGISFGASSFQNGEAFLNALQSHFDKISASAVSALFSIFGSATATLFVIAMAFFISLERNFIERVIAAFSPKKYQEYSYNLWKRAKRKVSGWFITRVIGMLFVGSCTYIVLRVLNVEYAFLLSLVAGLFDVVPIIGPSVAGVIMGLVISLSSVFQALFAVGAFVVIQQLENSLLFPILFKKFIGVSPVLVLIALAIGGRLWGPAGAILAIPLAGVFLEVLKDYLRKIKKEKPEEYG